MQMSVSRKKESIKRVLVVDSDHAVADILGANLGSSGIEVILAQTRAQGLGKASIAKPDLILLSGNLPRGDSLEVCQRLKESRKTNKIPVIMIGGKNEDQYISACIAAGAEDYIPWPIDTSEVVALVAAHFRRVERKGTANSTTRLPGLSTIRKRVEALIEEGRPLAVMYVDLVSSNTFVQETKAAAHNRSLRIVVRILTDAVELFGNEDDLIGQVENNSFAIVTTPARAENLCRKIVDSFDSQEGRPQLAQSSAPRPGGADYKSQLTEPDRISTMSLSIAVVTNERRRIASYLELARIGDQLGEYVKSLPGSNYAFDRRNDNAIGESEKGRKHVLYGYRNDTSIMLKALPRISFLYKALIPAVGLIESSVDSLLGGKIDNVDSRQLGNLELTRKRTYQLMNLLRELESLGGAEWATTDTFSRKATLTELIDLSVKLARGLADERGVRLHIEKGEIVKEPLTDNQSLLQVLFYLLRNEIESSHPGGRVSIGVSKETENFVAVQVTNPKHYVLPKELASLLKPELESTSSGERVNDLRWATALTEAFGGVLRAKSTKPDGTTHTVIIPREWSSRVDRINRLQFERERSGKAARNLLEHIRNGMLLTTKKLPAAFDKSLHELDYKIGELQVLCNLGLLLADEFSNDLERQQDRIAEFNAYGDVVLEVVLELLRQIARLAGAGDLFDPESGRRVARYTLTIGYELKLDRDELLSLHNAALLKDLGLAFAPSEAFGSVEGLTDAERLKLKQILFNIQKSLSRLSFLTPALGLLSQKYERYDGTGYPQGLRGDEIPLGARILAVAELLAAMPWGLVSVDNLDIESVVKEIIDYSSQSFDPRVVNALIKSLRKRRLSIKEEIMAPVSGHGAGLQSV